jgi:hypothetical protein
MMNCWKNRFILQKNILKINREFKKVHFFQVSTGVQPLGCGFLRLSALARFHAGWYTAVPYEEPVRISPSSYQPPHGREVYMRAAAIK